MPMVSQYWYFASMIDSNAGVIMFTATSPITTIIALTLNNEPKANPKVNVINNSAVCFFDIEFINILFIQLTPR